MIRPLTWLSAVAISAAFWLSLGFATVDLGGSVADYLARALVDTTPIEGVCASACTMRLYRARCIRPDALLLFHAATTPLGTLIMLRMYPPRIRAWALASGALAGPGLTAMTGREAIGLGVRAC